MIFPDQKKKKKPTENDHGILTYNRLKLVYFVISNISPQAMLPGKHLNTKNATKVRSGSDNVSKFANTHTHVIYL